MTLLEADATVDPSGIDEHIFDHLGECLRNIFLPPSCDPPANIRRLVANLTKILAARGEGSCEEFRGGLTEALPHLRAFAISLSRNPHRAEDLVQETMLKALHFADKFEAGSNLQGWLFTILRNLFYSEHRKWDREIADSDGLFAAKLGVMPEQDAKMGHRDLIAALDKMPHSQREALMLVGAQGVSYEKAAEICRVPIGTIKSRVNRGRLLLAELLAVEDGDFAGHGISLAALGANARD